MLDVWLATDDDNDDVIFLFAIFEGIFLVRSTGALIKSYTIRKNRLLPMQIVFFFCWHLALMYGAQMLDKFFRPKPKTTSTLEIGMGKMAIVLAVAVWMDVAPVWNFARFRKTNEKCKYANEYNKILNFSSATVFGYVGSSGVVRYATGWPCQSIVFFTIASTLKDIWFVCWMRDTQTSALILWPMWRRRIYSLWIRRLFINNKHTRETHREWGKPFAEIRWRIWNRKMKSRKNLKFHYTIARYVAVLLICLCVEFTWYFIGSS